MPRCQGLPDGPCPKGVNNRSVKSTQGDLFLCASCEEARFPRKSSAGRHTPLQSSTASTHTHMHKKTATNPKKPASDSAGQGPQKTCGVCPRCHETTDRECILCDICHEPFHALCTSLSPEVFDALMLIVGDVGWVCADCRAHCSSKIVTIQSSLSRINEEMSDMRSIIADLKSELDNVKSCATKTVVHQSSSASCHTVASASPVGDVDDLHRKIEISKIVHDINRRKSNVVISGLAESTGISESDQNIADLNTFIHLCEEHLDVKPAVSQLGCTRLGKVENHRDKPRKLLVHLRSESAASSILASAQLLRRSDDSTISSNVFINPDLTPADAKIAFEKRQRRRELKNRGQQSARTQSDYLCSRNGSTVEDACPYNNTIQYVDGVADVTVLTACTNPTVITAPAPLPPPVLVPATSGTDTSPLLANVSFR